LITSVESVPLPGRPATDRIAGTPYKRVVLLFSTLSFVSLMTLFSFTSILGDLKNQLALTNAQFGLLLSAFSIAFATAQIPGGIFSDKCGGKIVSSVGVTIMAIAALSFSFSSDYIEFLILRCLAGFFGGLILPSSVKLLSDWYPSNERGIALGIFGLGQGLGFVVTYAVGSIVVQYFGWRMGSIFSGMLGLAAAVLAFVFLKNTTGTNIASPLPSKLATEGNFKRNLLLLVAVNFTALSVLSGTLQFTPQFLLLRFNFSTITGGFVTSLVGITNIVASYSGGVSSKKFGGSYVVIGSMLMCVVLPAFLGYSYSTGFVFVLVALVGFATMFYFGPLFAGVARVGRERPGTVFGVFNATSFGASALSPLILGYILDSTHEFELAFASLSVIALIGLGAALTLKRTSFFARD